MHRNNMLNDISVSGKSNFQYEQNDKRRLKSQVRPIITFNSNAKYAISEHEKYTSYEETTDSIATNICSYYRKGGILTDAPQSVMNQRANTSIGEDKKYMSEHNSGILNPKNKVELSMKATPCLKQEDCHFEGGHGWSQLSTNKICKILEGISGKKHKTRGQSAPLQKAKYPQKVDNQKTDKKNQNWSQIPNEDICALIEKIAIRRNKNLKRINRSCSQIQEMLGCIDSAENRIDKAAIAYSPLFTAVRENKDILGYNFDSDGKIPKAICLPHHKEKLHLVSFLQMKKNELGTTCKNHEGELVLRKFDDEVTVNSNCATNNFFNEVIATLNYSVYHEMTVYTSFIRNSNVANNIWGSRKCAFQLLKPEAVDTTNNLHHFALPQDIHGDFMIAISKYQFDRKNLVVGLHYSSKELRLLHSTFGTNSKKILYHPIPRNITTIKEDCPSDTEYNKKRSQKNVLKYRTYSNSSLVLKEIGTNGLDSIESFGKSQSPENKGELSDINYDKGSTTHNRSILACLGDIFHRFYYKSCSGKTDLSETLFYDNSTEKWVKMGELVHH